MHTCSTFPFRPALVPNYLYIEREGGGGEGERQVHMYVALVMMLHKDPHAFRIGSEARVEEVVRDFHV